MKYGIANNIGQPSQIEVDQIVKYAVEKGIMYYDTAQSYGNSEAVLGKALLKTQNRYSIRVVSKLAPDLQDSSSAVIINSVIASVRKLNIEFLHGFLAHRVEAIYTRSYSLAVQELKVDGLIMKSGVSVYTPDEAITALENPLVEILQIPFNILDRRWIDQGIIEKAEKKNVQLMFRSIFLQGLIFLSNGDLERQKMDWAKPYLEQFNKLISATSLTPMELSFGILSNISGDNIIIVGIDNLTQLQNNFKHMFNVKLDQTFAEKWWSSIPVFPEKLLNPSLWN